MGNTVVTKTKYVVKKEDQKMILMTKKTVTIKNLG